MASFSNRWSQLRPPPPVLTESDLSDLQDKVYIVTGANTGVGKELAQILYAKNARVYVGARSEEKANAAIASIQAAAPDSKGALIFLKLDLADFSTIKATAEFFLARESKLHVLFNNAGVMVPPSGSKNVQGYELQLATNTIGPFLLTKLLTPILAATAKAEPANTVRVIWVGSSATEELSHKPGGLVIDNLDYHKNTLSPYKYGVSKAGNYLHAAEYARRHSDADGIVSVALNPGNLESELTRHLPWLVKTVMRWTILYPPVYGAYTEMFAGFSPEVTVESTKKHNYWIVPWGRFAPIRSDLIASMKPPSEGGTGLGGQFWGWTEEQIKPYV
ncbi:NAD(P)-binding protein [Thozetella sp. PMI_491]|nr:NAD(P)-binding protein [Thozetella sp. PMI_491]